MIKPWIRITIAVVVLALPQGLLTLGTFPPWVCRLIGVLGFHLAVTAGALWLSLVPGAVLGPGARLLNAEYAAVRGPIIAAIRLIVAVFLAFFAWKALWPTALDLAELSRAGELPVRTVQARAASERFGWLKQTILISSERESYQFFYANRKISVPGIYEIRVLSRARLILDARQAEGLPDCAD